jgi:hypothetical protein
MGDDFTCYALLIFNLYLATTLIMCRVFSVLLVLPLSGTAAGGERRRNSGKEAVLLSQTAE